MIHASACRVWVIHSVFVTILISLPDLNHSVITGEIARSYPPLTRPDTRIPVTPSGTSSRSSIMTQAAFTNSRSSKQTMPKCTTSRPSAAAGATTGTLNALNISAIPEPTPITRVAVMPTT